MSAILDVVAATTAPALPDVNNTLGVLLVCMVIAAYMYGMSSSQAYIYYDRFPKDSWKYKTLVAVVWALDTFHTAVMSHTVYYYTVTHFGDVAALKTKPVWSFNSEVIVIPIIAWIVQWYFAYRAFASDRKNLPLSIAIAVLAVAQLGVGLATAGLAFMKLNGFDDLVNYNYILISWLAIGSAADLLVTISLLWVFYRNKTTFTEEDGFMTKILMYGLHTGLFTTIVTITNLILVVASSHTLLFSGINYILGKMYTNTILYVLNRRAALDPRYPSASSGSRGSDQKNGSGGERKHHEVSSNAMPTFAPNNHPNQYSLSAPRMAARDPYAPDALDEEDVEYGADKPPSLAGERDAMGRTVVFEPSDDMSFVASGKEAHEAEDRRHGDF